MVRKLLFPISSSKQNSDMVGKIHALSTDCGYLYFRKSADAVSVFGTLKVINQNNIDNPTIGEIPDFLNPNYDYAVLNVISNYAPYIPVGTLWIYRNGEINYIIMPKIRIFLYLEAILLTGAKIH